MTASAIIEPQTWNWQGHKITYQQAGDTGAAVVLVHGFGASWGHWRKNLPVLGESCRCFAIDLIGFGGSAKPQPGIVNYTFETWGQQLGDFCREVVGGPAFLIGNSIGCIVVMQTAVDYPELALGVAAINCSIRLLHDRKRVTLPWYRNYGSMVMQQVLGNKQIGGFFFKQIAKPKVVRKILLQAYRRPEAVSDELIDLLMKPSQDPGAADVFLAFTRYSQGPLPEDLLPRLTCPTVLLWGTEDPWEPVGMGRKLAEIPTVNEFVPLEGLGHCPQDEAPEIVNPILLDWIKQHQSTTLLTDVTH
ncbi:alpha/beta hydrolase [Pleurocapsa sp. CCALA 161]|uniref:alpha/beta fold hydrolase n=1 Tax=Pleurocapsa sp. CCALA 161 TaxID=2107688 RepID=UPI000D07B608|nr:alpha/beta fold hydrolase [Pleurocapsa sp. CCALA 161]PSB07225.1 alpha/beta hydrolase [Pleurocapsa sp. CCALA 161]